MIIVIKVIGWDDWDNNTRERDETSISEIIDGESERRDNLLGVDVIR